MHLLTIFALGFAPAIFWLAYFYKRDALEPEPKLLVVRTFFLGLLVTFPVAIFQGALASVFGFFILAVVVAPIVEELAKYSVVRYGIFENREFNEPMDGIVYAAAAALGFASIENAFYILSAYFESPAGAVMTFTFRALFSVPAHALISSTWGYALGRAKFVSPERRNAIIYQGIIIAIILHSLFNFLAGIMLWAGIIAMILLLVPAMWLLVNRNISRAIEVSPP